MNKKKLAIFGSENTIFLHSYIKSLSVFFDVMVFNSNRDSRSNLQFYNYYEQRPNVRASKVRKFTKFLNLQKSATYQNFVERRDISSSLSEKERVNLEEGIANFDPDIIFFFWGTNFRREIDFLKKKFPEKRFVLSVNSYPTRTLFNSVNPFLKDDSAYFKKFDGLIFSSSAMKDYFVENDYIGARSDFLVCPDFIFQEKYSSNVAPSFPIPKERKNLIFLGNTQFSERSIDDISSLLSLLSKRGIGVYIQKSNNNTSTNPMINYFEPFSFDDILAGKLRCFINKFDGVLYSYNDSNALRCRISVTTRLLLAESSEVPVYVFGQLPSALSESLLDILPIKVETIDTLVDLLENGESSRKNIGLSVEDRIKMIKQFLLGDI